MSRGARESRADGGRNLNLRHFECPSPSPSYYCHVLFFSFFFFVFSPHHTLILPQTALTLPLINALWPHVYSVSLFLMTRISFIFKHGPLRDDGPKQRFQVPGLEDSTVMFKPQRRCGDLFYTVLLSQVAGTFLGFDHVEVNGKVVPILNNPS